MLCCWWCFPSSVIGFWGDTYIPLFIISISWMIVVLIHMSVCWCLPYILPPSIWISCSYDEGNIIKLKFHSPNCKFPLSRLTLSTGGSVGNYQSRAWVDGKGVKPLLTEYKVKKLTYYSWNCNLGKFKNNNSSQDHTLVLQFAKDIADSSGKHRASHKTKMLFFLFLKKIFFEHSERILL